MKYAAVIERTGNGYGTFILDLPGCVAASDTLADVCRDIQLLIKMHVESMIEHGEDIPEPSLVEFFEVAVKASA